MRLVSSDAQSTDIELRLQVADNLLPVAADVLAGCWVICASASFKSMKFYNINT